MLVIVLGHSQSNMLYKDYLVPANSFIWSMSDKNAGAELCQALLKLGPILSALEVIGAVGHYRYLFVLIR